MYVLKESKEAAKTKMVSDKDRYLKTKKVCDKYRYLMEWRLAKAKRKCKSTPMAETIAKEAAGL